jgi:hypothetical protein
MLRRRLVSDRVSDRVALSLPPSSRTASLPARPRRRVSDRSPRAALHAPGARAWSRGAARRDHGWDRVAETKGEGEGRLKKWAKKRAKRSKQGRGVEGAAGLKKSQASTSEADVIASCQ